MNVKINAQSAGAWLLRLLSLAGVAVGAINPASLPTSLRATFIIVSGVVLALDRYVTDPSTGNPPAPSSTTVQHPPGTVITTTAWTPPPAPAPSPAPSTPPPVQP